MAHEVFTLVGNPHPRRDPHPRAGLTLVGILTLVVGISTLARGDPGGSPPDRAAAPTESLSISRPATPERALTEADRAPQIDQPQKVGTMPKEAERIPRIPKGVGPQGRKLWAEVLRAHELTESEMAILTACCRCVTTLERIADELESTALTSLNARGDVVASPLVVEQRMQSACLTRLIASLRLPDDDSDARPQRRGAARAAYGLRAIR